MRTPQQSTLMMTTLSLVAVWTRRTRAFVNPKTVTTHSRREDAATTLAALDSRQLRFYGNYNQDYSRSNHNDEADDGSSGGFPAFWESITRSFLPASIVAVTEPMLSQIITGETVPSTKAEKVSLNSFMASIPSNPTVQAKRSYGPYINLSAEERELFRLLRQAREETELSTTLRVAGGWVRDKLLATPEFARPHHDQSRLTSKYKQASMGRQGTKVLNSEDNNQPVDIDIALDDMLGREFAERLNDYLEQVGEETHSVGVVLKNPEKSKHLETATMKVGTFWIDFVNLRAEEYTQDSRIPDLMRIGTPAEDAFRRDLTINALFYNINNGQVEDWTGRGFDDLRRGIVATPLAPLTTLLDDPLRALRSVRFAARLRFTMDDSLVEAAMDSRVRRALAEKVSRERVGGEVDLMLRSPDPVGAMRLLINLKLATTVFPLENCFENTKCTEALFDQGIELLCETHEYLEDCRAFPPTWCQNKGTYTTHGVNELTLREDDESRRFLWYAAFLKPFHDYSRKLAKERKSLRQGKKANRSAICRLLVDELKRPVRESEAVEKIMIGADEFTKIISSGYDLAAISILLSDIRVEDDKSTDRCRLKCYMNGKRIFSASEDDPLWEHAVDFRLQCATLVRKLGQLWRAALFLSLSERLADIYRGDLDYVIEGDVIDESQEELRLGELERYDAFATAIQRMGIIGIWNEKPLLDGKEIKEILPTIPMGPAFREVMDEQERWMITHPGAGTEFLVNHLYSKFPDFVGPSN